MSELIGVQIRPSDRVQFFDANGIDLVVGDRVVVETWDGEYEGVVVIAPGQVMRSDLRGPLDRVVRKASDD